ncbi:hypothetical protein HOE37_00465 [Candidatus Woesearchaeota archaeon]|jgi:hypothetical protein|nr:hypothetical protein [Candidatus Woesearchaeota archaeon]MBT4110309.1 hypothetical protein [Candidatus Woesearchaeota archaeon]MBT4336167.1 hypothetical protein [Candidatus Woesearchaeota archaeon]MBT4468854.1 hypothetical protein [Candidatus Woesearchaeota archaeon]MBT6744827.1 hypothetical protein [Candidatus Woesearchaeota archaeon]
MILIDPETNCTALNLDQLVENVNVIRKEVDSRIIKPPSYFLIDLMSKMLIGPEERGVELFLIDHIMKYNGEVQIDRSYSHRGKKFVDVKFKPVIPESDILVHQAWLRTGDSLKKGVDRILRNQVIGNPGVDRATYLKEASLPGGDDDDLGINGWMFSLDYQTIYSVALQFEIDVEELQKTRNIFYDPEGLAGAQFGNNIEYLSTYFVFGGIPCQAIRNIQYCVMDPQPITEDDKDQFIIHPDGRTLRQFLEPSKI